MVCPDSGTSSHMTCMKELFTDEELSAPQNVELGDGRTVKVLGVGKVKLDMLHKSELCSKAILYVLYVPDLASNLFSVRVATENIL